jgi:GTP cyclohydrolase I
VTDKDRFMVDVGMQDLPYPMRTISKLDPEGQATVANISVSARIMQNFEARWIDRFIQTLHEHRGFIGTRTLKKNILDYVRVLDAATVKIGFDYPFFVEKETPASKQKCLVGYRCAYSAKAHKAEDESRIIFRIEVPCITTYPISDAEKPGGLFGQLSILDVEVESSEDVYPEDLVALVDRHALAPVYSFLTEEDQTTLIERIHSHKKTSVVVVDDVKNELARDAAVKWYTVRSRNSGMLHSYSTFIRTEKSPWVPFSGYEDEI